MRGGRESTGWTTPWDLCARSPVRLLPLLAAAPLLQPLFSRGSRPPSELTLTGRVRPARPSGWPMSSRWCCLYSGKTQFVSRVAFVLWHCLPTTSFSHLSKADSAVLSVLVSTGKGYPGQPVLQPGSGPQGPLMVTVQAEKSSLYAGRPVLSPQKGTGPNHGESECCGNGQNITSVAYTGRFVGLRQLSQPTPDPRAPGPHKVGVGCERMAARRQACLAYYVYFD